MKLRAIVTAGGTTESIDAVRTLDTFDISGSGDALQTLTHFDISNISKGRFPLEIARAIARRGTEENPIEVTLIAKKELAAELRGDPSASGLKVVPFRSFADLSSAIDAELSNGQVDLLVMAAAVSDYSPVAVDGKISSANEDMQILLKKNPKILGSLRERLGQKAVLVGFKLLAGVSHDTLISVAQTQAAKAGCTLTIANDAKRIDWSRGWHPVSVVSESAVLRELEGLRADVAEILAAEFVTRISG